MLQLYKQTVATASTLHAVTLDEIKDHVGADGYDEYDPLLATLRDRATEAVGKRCKRQILSATYTLTLDSFPAEILIDMPPVISIASIVYTDNAGDAQTLTAVTEYQTDMATLDGPARIMPAYGTSWPTVMSDTYGAVVVTFVSGYAAASDIPQTIKHEIIMLIAEWFRNREGTSDRPVNQLPTGLDMLSSLNDTGGYG